MSGMTRGQQANRLVSIIRGMTHDEARRLINLAYVSNCEEHGWFHLLKRFTLQTEPRYNSGTVLVTAASTTVNLNNDGSSAWVQAWVTAPSNRKMIIAGRNEPYDVSAMPTTMQGTLADPWAGGDNAAATYSLYRDTYALPADCGMHKMVALYDPQILYRLKNFNQVKFLGVRGAAPWLITIPECFTVVQQTTETPPRPQIQMYPAPADMRVYHGWYFRRPAFPASDAEYLDWPSEFDDMHWVRAALDYYRIPTNFSPKYLSEFKPMYADLFSKMKSAMDGQSAIDFEIEEARLGRGFGGGSGWNPDPSSLFGGGCVNWG